MTLHVVTDREASAAGLLTVGQVAEQAGVAPSAVRFYERRGLVDAVRTSGNQRRFEAHVPCLVRVARVAQRVGLSIAEIQAIFDRIPDAPTPEQWVEVTGELVAEANRRIAELHGVLDDLSASTRLCEVPATILGNA